ncbi:conserved hypothetical protein [Dehalogenimonas lykanthroporepellens BL-DC-9]|nr:conserved hypothetical protein [Dehalogenimonas lykanthroporepellens BL-DC-9]
MSANPTMKIQKAYRQLLARDNHLLSVEANERSITHKLAEYLQVEFPEWNVDCEYNRNGLDGKKLSTFIKDIQSDDTDAVSVYPDIIIHHRGTENNYVVIEAKKSNSRTEDMDNEKLCAYRSDLGYAHAYKVTFPIGVREINVQQCVQKI